MPNYNSSSYWWIMRWVLANHRMEHLLSQLIMFLPRPPSSRPGWKPPFPGRGGFCASSLFSMLTLMSRASVKKASSTLMLALAEVSMNLIPYSMASCSPRSFETCKCEEYKSVNLYTVRASRPVFCRSCRTCSQESSSPRRRWRAPQCS